VEWSQFYASQAEILKYWQKVAEKYDLRKLIKFSHRVIEGRWHEDKAQWELKVEDLSTGAIITESCDIFITATGVLNQWEWPSTPGLHNFEGKLMHSAAWDESFDFKVRPYSKIDHGVLLMCQQDKTIAVIGAGSSGIQIVPSLQPLVKHLDHYVRGKTWIATPMAAQELEKRGASGSNFSYTPDEIAAWKNNPASYLAYRKQVENTVQSDHEITLRDSQLQKMARGYFESLMAQRLAKKPEILQYILPAFSPLCKRLTPGPGYLEALTEDNVAVIPTKIEQVTKTGIMTVDGKHRDVEAIVCATGFNTHFTNRFPIYGLNGEVLFERAHGPKTSTYLSMMVDTHPNFFMLLGPNAGIGAGNLLMIIERLVDYCAQMLAKMQTENIRTVRPLKSKVDAFTRYTDEFHRRTVYSEECSSWYKTDGRVTALWPGSSLHAIKALEKQRWEDFEYSYVDDMPMGWLGNGSTVADHDPNADKAYYLTSTTLLSVEDSPLAVNSKARSMKSRL
jgi:cation diffusion facilitator CzcD-associated flavoprotein CzcO